MTNKKIKKEHLDARKELYEIANDFYNGQVNFKDFNDSDSALIGYAIRSYVLNCEEKDFTFSIDSFIIETGFNKNTVSNSLLRLDKKHHLLKRIKSGVKGKTSTYNLIIPICNGISPIGIINTDKQRVSGTFGDSHIGTNIIENKIIENNLTEYNLIEDNLTENNLSESNLIEDNLTESNLTEFDLNLNELIQGNIKLNNLIDMNTQNVELKKELEEVKTRFNNATDYFKSLREKVNTLSTQLQENIEGLESLKEEGDEIDTNDIIELLTSMKEDIDTLLNK